MKNFARTVGIAAFIALVVPVFGVGVLGVGIAEAATVSSITVQGNQRVEASTIRNYLTIKPGQSFGPAEVDESVKALFATGLFSDVSISQRGGTLVVNVDENRIVNSVVFEGNKKIKSNILAALVDTKARGVLTDAQLQSDTQRLIDYYDRSGRSNAAITPRLTELPNNRVDVVFAINEGGRTGVASITFVGNDAYSDHRLRGIIQTRKTNWLSWLNRRDVYDPAKIEADKELLRRFYMRHGYADFQVLASDVTFDEEQGKYHVQFTVEEGVRYRFGDITIDSSIPDVDVNALYHLVKIKKGKIFNASLVEKTIEELTVELSRHGYAFAQVRPRGDRNYEDSTISIAFLIDEGPRVYVERIDVYGNTKTRDYVIRREFDMAEGDAYNRVLVDRAERRLRALGFFKTVAITTEPGSAPDRVIVNVTVVEDSTGSFAVGGGYSTSDGFIAEISLTEKNFLGRGQNLRIAYGIGEEEDNYSLSFTDPYFLGYRMSFGVDLYARSADSSGDRPYDTETYGGGLRLGLPITDDLNLTLNYKLQNESISDSHNLDDTEEMVGTENVGNFFFPNGDTLTSSLGYSLVYSTIDDVKDPRNGLYLRFSQDFAGVGGDTQFVRTVADGRYYHEIGSDTDIVGLVRLHGGNITGLGEDVRTADNFFRGGETIRGFDTRGFGPRVDEDDLKNGGLPIGGKNYVAATAEVQFPMPMFPPDFGLRGAVFADAGVLFDYDRPSGTEMVAIDDENSIRSSIGASILWASPFGLLRADFAHVLTKEDYDETQFFRFSAGTQF